MSLLCVRRFLAVVILTGMVCLTGQTAKAAAPQPFGGKSEDVVLAVPAPRSEGLEVVHILVGSVVGMLPRLLPSSFETAPVEHPWVMWLPESQIDSSWYHLRDADHTVAVSPYILNGGARSAASAGLVLGLTY